MTAAALQSFIDLRNEVIAERIGEGGRDVCDTLTTSLDAALADLGGEFTVGAAVVALGRYGRGEQCTWSDVDVMILHSDSDPGRSSGRCSTHPGTPTSRLGTRSVPLPRITIATARTSSR